MDTGWPGLFTHWTLHRVSPANHHRVYHQGRTFGLADCGAVCIPPDMVPPAERTRCPRCWP